jgi:hypothetical protein
MTESPTGAYSREELADDARFLAQTLADSHPSPFTGHRNRVAYYRTLEELVREIPEEGESLESFYYRVQSFAAALRDGHTTVLAPASLDSDSEERLPLGFRVVGDQLYVSEVYSEDAELLGGRLLSVGDIEVPELRRRHSRLESADNRYGDLNYLGRTLASDQERLQQLLDSSTIEPSATVDCPDGTARTVTLEPVAAETPVATLEQAVDQPSTAGEPAYTFLDEDTVLLTLPDCASHREVHEVAAAPGGPAEDIYDTEETYRRLVGDPVPEGHDEQVADLPSATERLTTLVTEMADAETETLVVDTRHNTGGMSLLPYLLIYVLYGWDGIATAAENQYDAARVSPLSQDQLGEFGHDADSDGATGYDFSTYFAGTDQRVEEIRTQLSQLSPTFSAEVESGEHEARYCPDSVVVVTGPETFSAGMEIPMLLSHLGADIVGVPSSQSPNGPRDTVLAELPNTGLEVRLSNRYHVFQPAEDGAVLEPDVLLTPERFDLLDRRADASLELAVSYARGELPL